MLDGIEHGMDPPAAIETDVYECSPLEIAALKHLPQTLQEALQAVATNTLLIEAIGPLVMAQFIHLKQAEWLEYCHHVSEWERQRYGSAY